MSPTSISAPRSTSTTSPSFRIGLIELHSQIYLCREFKKTRAITYKLASGMLYTVLFYRLLVSRDDLLTETPRADSPLSPGAASRHQPTAYCIPIDIGKESLN